MNITDSPFYHQAIVGMVLAVTAPNKKKLNECIKLATDSKNSLLIQIEQFIMDKADELVAGSKEDFDKYFKENISEKLKEYQEAANGTD
tara:strand:- start:298 stop:564 length:267 start_codon:yes stop_codon:yes gene_type:complete